MTEPVTEALRCQRCWGKIYVGSFCSLECATAAYGRAMQAAKPVVDSEVVEVLREAIDGWEAAYPLKAFPEPDLGKAAELLKAGGMTLDAVSASNMRHVVSCLAPPIRALLAKLEGAK